MQENNQENIEKYISTETVQTSQLTEHSPNNPPWNSLEALLFWLFSVALIVIIPMLFLAPYLVSKGVNFRDIETFQKAVMEPYAVLLQIGAIIPAHILTIIGAWFVVTRFKKHSFTKMLGWHWAGYKAWQIVLFMFAALMMVFVVAIGMNQIFGQQDNELLKVLRSSRYAVFLIAFMATVSAPFVEEVVYRGILYSAFQRTFNIPVAVLLVTFVFALVHFPQYWGDYATLSTLMFLSLLLTLVRVKTNSLLPCILLHFLINGIQSVILILEPYLPDALNSTNVQSFFF